MTRHWGPDGFFTRPGQRRKVNFRDAKEWAGNSPHVGSLARIINSETEQAGPSLIPQCSGSLVSIVQWPMRWQWRGVLTNQRSTHRCSGPGQSVISASHCIQYIRDPNSDSFSSGSMSVKSHHRYASYLNRCLPTRHCGHWIRDTCHGSHDTCPLATCRCPHCPTCPLLSPCRRPDCNWPPPVPLLSSPRASHLFFRSRSPRHPKIMGGVKI